MSNKKKILAWSDFVAAGTGFGTVSRHVLKELHKTGDYEISQLAINYSGQFFDQELYPYQVVPAKLEDPKDPHGRKAFLKTFSSGLFDYVWIMNDMAVVESVARKLPEIIQQMKMQNKKVPVIIYYYPVDCHVLPSLTGMIKLADVPVAYTEYGRDKTIAVAPSVEGRIKIIPHGTESSSFFRLSEEERLELRFKLLKIKDPETFVWLNVNRNSIRKDLPRTIEAFKRFQEKVPKSKMYLHTMRQDVGGDLNVALWEHNLDDRTDVLFPNPQYSPKNPMPIEVLNMFYNCADGFLTTTLGEGWGLTHTDAMTAQIPVVCPDNTVFPNQLDNGNRGYLYPCKNNMWVDSSGYRPQGLVDDIVDTMMKCYEENKSGANSGMIERAKEYSNEISWENVGAMWTDLFKNIKVKSSQAKTSIGEVL